MAFGANLKKAREAKGLTQKKLARLMGYEESSGNSPISGWETEDKVPSPEMVVRFAEVLGVGTWELLEGVVTEIDRLRQKPSDPIRQGGVSESSAGGDHGETADSAIGTKRALSRPIQPRRTADAETRLREKLDEMRAALDLFAKTALATGETEAPKADSVAPRKSSSRRRTRKRA